MNTGDEKAWQEVIDEAVARGLLIPIGLNSDGKMVYRRTEKRSFERLGQRAGPWSKGPGGGQGSLS